MEAQRSALQADMESAIRKVRPCILFSPQAFQKHSMVLAELSKRKGRRGLGWRRWC